MCACTAVVCAYLIVATARSLLRLHQLIQSPPTHPRHPPTPTAGAGAAARAAGAARGPPLLQERGRGGAPQGHGGVAGERGDDEGGARGGACVNRCLVCICVCVSYCRRVGARIHTSPTILPSTYMPTDAPHRPHAPGDGEARAVRLGGVHHRHRGLGHASERGAPPAAVRALHAARLCLYAQVAGGGYGLLGQPLHAPPRHRVERAPHAVPDDDQGGGGRVLKGRGLGVCESRTRE